MSADRVIARLMAVFGEPKTPDPDLYVEEFRKALVGYEGHILDKAVDRWMKRDTAFWPRPGELLAEARSVAAPVRRRGPEPGSPEYLEQIAREMGLA